MKTLTNLFLSTVIASLFFVSSAYAGSDNLPAGAQVVQSSGGGYYHQCFLEGNPGCKS